MAHTPRSLELNKFFDPSASPPECEWKDCNNTVQRRSNGINKFNRFCSNSCRAKWQADQPERKALQREVGSRIMKANHADPEFAAMRQESGRQQMTLNHQDPEFTARRDARWKQVSDDTKKYRREHEGRTPAEDKLFLALKAAGFSPVHADRRFMKGTRGHILDITVPEHRINIEIDGSLHRPEKDRKRDDFVKSQGWVVLRFKNEEIHDHMDEVMDIILTLTDRLLEAA